MSTREQRKDVIEGLKGRILSKLAFGAGTGVVVGSLLAVLNNTPLVRNTATSTASFVIVMGVFSALQESARLARRTDSPANSVIAGAGTGAFLYKLHGSRPAVGAVLCSALAGGLHWASDRVDLSHGLRGALISMDLLDDDSPPDSLPDEEPRKGGAWFERIAPYLPIKKFSDEEWDEYQRSQDELQRKRIQVALEGGLPVMVERRRQQQKTEQQQQQQHTQTQQPSSGSSSDKGA